MSDDLTLVLLAWRKRRRNYRLVFGEPKRTIRLDWQRRLAVFAPGDVFGYERWEGDKYGTQYWAAKIVQAEPAGASIQDVAGISPGGNLLVSLSGKGPCKALLAILDELRARAMLNRLTPADWRVLGARLANGLDAHLVLNRIAERC